MQNTVSFPHNDDDGEGALPIGTQLQDGRYTIVQFLVRGGFGLTYVARDDLNRQVLIKECFTDSICARQDMAVIPRDVETTENFRRIKNRFDTETKMMARICYPNVPRVHQVFRQNNTLYLVTDLIQGMDFLNVSLHDPKRLTPKLIRQSLDTALVTLSAIHAKGVLHRDISPDNLVLDTSNDLHIVDFGNASDIADSAAPVVSTKPGYTPPEFYDKGCHAAQTADLYGLAATFYQIITGHAPPDANVRKSAATDPYRPLAQSRSDFDMLFLGLIDDALSLSPEERPYSAQAWRAALCGCQMIAAAPNQLPDPLVERVVSSLVAEQTLETESDGTTTKEAQKANAKRSLVDLFGDPIDDFDAWLAKQKAQISPCIDADSPQSRVSKLVHDASQWLYKKTKKPAPLFPERKQL